MIEEAYIAQLEKQYKHYLRDIIAGNPFAPILLRGGKNRPQTTVDLHKLVALFQKHDKSIHPRGWHIEWEDWASKKLGVQRWPSLVRVDTEEDYLFLLDRETLSLRFKRQLDQLVSWRAGIRDFLFHRPEWVLDLEESWPGIQAVVDYLLQHDVSGHYLRSLPVPVHTKFIQQYKTRILALLQYLNSERFNPHRSGQDSEQDQSGQNQSKQNQSKQDQSGQNHVVPPGTDLEEILGLKRKPYLFTLRWLDAALGEKYCAGMEVFGLPKEYLATVQWPLRQVIFVENETNLYLLPRIPGTLALFSAGKALYLLGEIPLLANSVIYYWGDLDEEGFIMLNDIRNLYSHVKSIFMDIETVSAHETEPGSQSPYKRSHLPLLSPSEQLAFEHMRRQSGRIEQEKLRQAWIAEKLKDLLT